MILPPPGFDHPYDGQTIEWVGTLKQTTEWCRKAGSRESGLIYGCQFKLGKTCFVVRATNTGFDQSIRRFEISHCNGYRPQHKDCQLCQYIAAHK